MMRGRNRWNLHATTDREAGLVRRRLRRGAMAVVAVAAIAFPAGGALADTQRLPDAACNAGTLGTDKRGPVPHLHDFDGDGEFGCYHRNPALPSQRSE